ncbi:hypothetical protein DL769_005916 [Monosporascus sp. CRB-8-3]|nr:hypothetical protein DL769_005916 [Monosporascus sp. CRB-8-3]
MASAGTKVIRVWANARGAGGHRGSNLVNNPPHFEATLGQYNHETFDALDNVIDKIARVGMKVIIPPHDLNSRREHKDVYYEKWGYGCFYELQQTFDASNLQNEPMTPDPSACQAGDVHGWLCGGANYLRQELGADQPIRMLTGGVSGDISNECTFIEAVTACNAVDLIVVSSAMYWQFFPDAVEECPDDPAQDEGDRFGIFIGGGTDIETFSERGAVVGLGTNAQQALEHVLPGRKDDLLKRAGAVLMNSSRSIVGSGPYAGQIIFDFSGDDPGIIVHRASLLRELVAPLPKDSLHTNKKLAAINPTPDMNAVEVMFEDRTVERFDAVIGADGIFSSVRSYVLQDDADQFAASPAGFWDCRNPVPPERAKVVLGEELFELDRQYGWVGDGGFLMHDVLENRTMVQCIISAVEHSQTHERKRVLTKETLTQTLSSWLDGPIAKGMIEWEHKATPTYVNGSVCVIRDAAHATTPWQGSGAAMAFEDAMILKELLGNITSSADIKAAFKAYDAIRRPRCQRVIDSSRETGWMFCGQHADAGLDPEKLRALLAPRWDFIFGLDMNAHKQEALHKLREMQQG